MGFRFRKSFKLAPGVRLNVGTRSASLSVLGFNFGSRGITSGFSIPGTGISCKTSLTADRRQARHTGRTPRRSETERVIRAEARRLRAEMQETLAEALAAERQQKLAQVSV